MRRGCEKSSRQEAEMEPSQPIYRLKRRARLLSRTEGIPLHAALDRVAREEGFLTWSMLAASTPVRAPGRAMLSGFSPGDLLLLAGRPRQGKTLLSLEIAIEAMKAGRSAAFFTLECTRAEVLHYLALVGGDLRSYERRLRIDTSDDISASHIIRELDSAAPGTVVVVDYLQLLDQKRQNPDLCDQVASLRLFAQQRGLVVVCLSQIHRSFDEGEMRVPSLDDVRLPNPVDLNLFTKACFVHDGRVTLLSRDEGIRGSAEWGA
jgi:replicative DNA helicase